MKDIKKPEFMKAAIQARSHNAMLEFLIAMLVFFVGDILISFLQVPAMVVYLIGNKEYMSMIFSNSIDFERIMDIMQNMPDWVTLVTLLSEAGLIVVFILYCRIFEKRKGNTLGFRKKGLVKEYVRGVLIGMLAFLAVYGICIVTGSAEFFRGEVTVKTVLYLIGFFFGYMIQGMAEEVICRGYFMVSLTRRYNMTASILFSSLFFAVLHGMNMGISFLAYLNLFLFGIFLALLFVRYENIWIVAAVHSIWNYFQGNIFGVQVSGMKLQPSLFQTSLTEGRGVINGGSFGMEGGLAVTVVLLLGSALVLWSMSRHGYFVQAEPVRNPYDEAARRMYSQQPPYQNGMYGNWQNGQNMPNQTENRQKDEAADLGKNQPEVEQTGEKVHENMGLNPEETPWHPKDETRQENTMTEFDQSYFKD